MAQVDHHMLIIQATARVCWKLEGILMLHDATRRQRFEPSSNFASKALTGYQKQREFGLTTLVAHKSRRPIVPG